MDKARAGVSPSRRVVAYGAETLGFPDFVKREKGQITGPFFVVGQFDDFRFSPRKKVMIRGENGFSLNEVLAVENGVLILDVALDFVVGSKVYVYPMLTGYLLDDMKVRAFSSSVLDSSLVFEAPTDQSFVKDSINADRQYYRGKPLCLWKPNWSREVRESWNFMLEVVDNGFGFPSKEKKVKSPVRYGSFDVLLKNRTDIEEVLSLFCYCRGKQASFYMPTWVDDFVFTEELYDGQTVIGVRGTEVKKLFDGSDVFKSICICVGDKAHVCGIVGIEEVGSDSRITLSAPITNAVKSATSASWLLRQRFSSDTLELPFYTDSVVQVTVNTVSVIEDFEVIEIQGNEISISGEYATLGNRVGARNVNFTTIASYHVSIFGDFIG
jgi:hypothetical protein